MSVPRVSVALTMVVVSLRPSCISVAVTRLLIRALSIIAGTATEGPGVVTIAVTRSDVALPPAVITIAFVGTAASAAGHLGVPLVIARIVVARIEIHGRTTLPM